MHYSDYLQLEKILGSQLPESNKRGVMAHDEMLFIVIHQTYELWFKQLLHEADSIIDIMKKPAINDNSPELQTVVHRLSRMATIIRVLVHQIDIMETMTPMDFLDFRDMLRPASGFQSVQFKILEARLGLKYEHRHGQEHYTSQLRTAEVADLRKHESSESLLFLVNAWLERIPFFKNANDPFWVDYRNRYKQSLSETEANNLEAFDRVFFSDKAVDGTEANTRTLSAGASRAALFIMLYRGYPILQLPFQLLNSLLEIDEQLSTWRYRHMSMVQRMIGSRIGTGGSTGRDYLRAALEKHYIFREIAQLTSFLIERSKLPSLDTSIEKDLGFSHA